MKILADISEDNMIPNILQNVLTAVRDGCSQLKRLEVSSQSQLEIFDLSSLDPVLLSQALIRLEACCFNDFGPLSAAQLVAVFTAIEQTNNLKLKSLILSNLDQNYSKVPTGILAAAVVKLKDTNILDIYQDGNLSPDLVTSLINEMAGSSIVNLRRLNLSLRKCSGVPPELFGIALVRIEMLVLTLTAGVVTEDQVLSLFIKISQSEQLRLRQLNLFMVEISHISPDIISEATIKLETFIAPLCDPTSEQVSAIFNKLTTSEYHKLTTLNLDHNDLSSIPTETLVGGISGLEKVDLSNSNLTAEQLAAIFAKLSTFEKHKLRNFLLGKNDLSSISTENLVTGISGLEGANLSQTSLTTEQLTGIYRMVAERKCSRLRWINLGGNDISSISTDIRETAKLNESVNIID